MADIIIGCIFYNENKNDMSSECFVLKFFHDTVIHFGA